MDYYEELGVSRDAPAEEIRQAYRRLARLLHPDRCTDEALRRQAELQMRRLNGILEILTDPGKRSSYDQTPVVRPAAGLAVRMTIPWLWIGAGVLATFCALLPVMLYRRPPAPTAKDGAKVLPPVVEKPVRAKRARRTGAQRIPPFPEATAAAPAADMMPDVDPAPLTTVKPIEIPPALPFKESSLRVNRLTLAGEWFYVSRAEGHPADLFPPEFIELRVTEDSGMVRGRYRARYKVSKQAISPNVSFEFQGRQSNSLPWRGPDGSQGEVSLKLLTPGALEVTWTTDHVGTDPSLVAGTATLVRKAD